MPDTFPIVSSPPSAQAAWLSHSSAIATMRRLENGDVRNVLHLHPALAPYKAAVLPLQKKLGDKAKELYAMLSKHFMVDYDETGAIGKRYRRQDEIGTPLCITVDFETVEGDPANDMQKDTVTVRDRDTMQQIRLPIDQLVPYIEKKIEF